MKYLFNILCLLPFVSSFLYVKTFYPRRQPLQLYMRKKYPLSKYHHERYIKRLNSRNVTEQTDEILNQQDNENDYHDSLAELYNMANQGNSSIRGVRIIINQGMFEELATQLNNMSNEDDEPEFNRGSNNGKKSGKKRSENFEVINKHDINFNNIGGYDNIKRELQQCIDILSNYTKYAGFNVRTPKGLIFEGPPGNGKTMFAKALAGEAKTNFIAVSGAEFQEKYVGVGSSRIRELFKLAKENIPCIVFIDEIDALGRKRSSDGETSTSERDSTLNELLVALDGFKNSTGIFLIGATNRADLLDPALVRPGRVDKRIFIGNPDSKTRRAILNIHLQGKPLEHHNILNDELVEQTNGLSGAEIENLLNEAMLNALRLNRVSISSKDIDEVMNKMMVGWQPNEHQFTNDIIDHIAVHELGHAIVGLLSKHHAKMTKVMINLSAPKSPAYTIFENTGTNILTREALFEHLMILLAGRIAEEVIYDVSVTTGAINDFEEALKLAQRMVIYYGMGEKVIYPSNSEKYKEIIDNEVAALINDAYEYAEFILHNSKDLIHEGAEILKRDKVVTADFLIELMNRKYQNVLSLKYK
uniref:AAA+ ATPase domain-containing protein n=1 Tax=viral metagenome TaxID=1070528 RepID=A0A6C0KH06_9ZZZZ